MGECIGLDFGTTYSVVSHLTNGQDNSALIPEAIDFGKGERTINAMETLVVKKPDGVRIGCEAVRSMRATDAKTFTGFKMLLDGTDPQKKTQRQLQEQLQEWKRRGYSRMDTPEQITTEFLSGLFDKARKSNPELAEIDNVVVGVPYVWTTNGEDSRKFKVVNIVKQVTGAKTVDFRSEPTLACAYAVQEINRARNGHFEGHILVIDYGGGTLDVTLCQVKELAGKSSIEVCNSWGAGENTDGKIGDAGLAFMEKVADLLLASHDIAVIEKGSKDYQAFVKGLETAIKDQSDFLKEICQSRWMRYFTDGGAQYNKKIEEISAYYKGEEYYVTYGNLARAYDTSIRPVLGRVLAEAKTYMDEKHIRYDDYTNGTFKIAMIGGFCNFALTEKQICVDTDWLMDHMRGADTRYTELGRMIQPTGRELAIAHGAALNANDVIVIKRQFPYTLCFYGETLQKDSNGRPMTKNGNYVLIVNEDEPFVMFRENEEYVPGKPVFLVNPDTREKLPVRGNGIPYIRRQRNNMVSEIRRPIQAMKLPDNVPDNLYIAMAMERNENLTLYVYNQAIFDALSPSEQEEPINKALINGPTSFPNIDTLLGNFYKIQREDENV